MPLYDENGSAIVAAAFWARLRDGMFIAVFYRNDRVWRERRLLPSASHAVYMVTGAMVVEFDTTAEHKDLVAAVRTSGPRTTGGALPS